ncbi:peptide-N4-(N-acetyl-beta- glucosaminyl)asparagine amidase [Phlyctochytrium planicorne]|nr:peptide-N4-(N-acetyl-beta- glucosaminyl)asparagine amidase [Phlyctochytrium planicorne]
MARGQIPVDLIHEEAEGRGRAQKDVPYQHRLMKSLMRWFKMEYMQWVDSPECMVCKATTEFQGDGMPTPQEAYYSASRVEKLQETNHDLLSRLPATLQEELAERDILEREELENPPVRESRPAELMGRQSGGKDWREARGEIGRRSAFKKGAALFSLSSSSELKLLGNARKDGGVLVVTDSSPDQKGAIWIPINSDTPMVITFTLRITPPSGSSGADGMALVFQSQGADAIGSGGCHLGYGGIKSSLAVEFDTYRSEDTCADPSGCHVSVHTRGSVANSSHHAFSLSCCDVPPLATGRPIYFCVLYKPDFGIEVLQADKAPVSDDDYSVLLSVPTDLVKTLGSGGAYLGFTAATGGLFEKHEVLDWNVNYLQSET